MADVAMELRVRLHVPELKSRQSCEEGGRRKDVLSILQDLKTVIIVCQLQPVASSFPHKSQFPK
jgi:hypothetical protein